MTECAFCRIVDATADGASDAAEIVYADDLCVGFLDYRPVFIGHTLLVPRTHVVTYADLPAADLAPFFAVGQRLERAVEQATGSDGSLVLMNNVVSQSVPHLHLHVIPRRLRDGLRFWLGPRTRYRADGPTMPDTGAAIRAALADQPAG